QSERWRTSRRISVFLNHALREPSLAAFVSHFCRAARCSSTEAEDDDDKSAHDDREHFEPRRSFVMDKLQADASPSAEAEKRLPRRTLLQGAAALAGLAAAGPFIWVPKTVRAQTGATGSFKHLIYIRLSGG